MITKWVKLWTSLKDNAVVRRRGAVAWAVIAYLLTNGADDDGRVTVSVRGLAAELQVTHQQLRTVLDDFEREGTVEMASTNRGTSIHLRNYGFFQTFNTQLTHQQHTNNTQNTNNASQLDGVSENEQHTTNTPTTHATVKNPVQNKNKNKNKYSGSGSARARTYASGETSGMGSDPDQDPDLFEADQMQDPEQDQDPFETPNARNAAANERDGGVLPKTQQLPPGRENLRENAISGANAEIASYPKNRFAVIAEAERQGYLMPEQDAADFLEMNARTDWHDRDGEKIKAWGRLLRGFCKFRKVPTIAEVEAAKESAIASLKEAERLRLEKKAEAERKQREEYDRIPNKLTREEYEKFKSLPRDEAVKFLLSKM